MNLNDLFNEEKVRLDPKCWTGKKIGNPKTKVKGGVRVNNCVPAESVEEANDIKNPLDLSQADFGGEDPDARDQYGNLKRSTSPGLGGSIDIGGVDIPAGAFDAGLGSAAAMGGLRGMFGKSKEAPVTEPKWTSSRIPGVDVHTGPPPTVTKPPNINRQIDPASDVPAYVRKGLPDPVTTPVGKPKITVRPGETQSQAMQRTKAEQEFNKFLRGQGGQSFGTAGAGRGGQGGPTAAQATSGSNQIPTIKLPNGQTIPDPARLSPSGQYNTQSGRKSIDQIERDDKIAVDAMANRARQSVADREARAKKQSDRIQPVQPSWKNRNTDVDLEEASRKKREQPEAKYDDQYDAMVARVQKLAGIGPMKTVWDPARRVYKNVPTADQPPKK